MTLNYDILNHIQPLPVEFDRHTYKLSEKLSGDLLQRAKTGDYTAMKKSYSRWNKPGDWKPVVMGFYGEAALAAWLYHQKNISTLPNFDRLENGDGGFDIKVRDVTIDVKCTFSSLLMIRSRNTETNYVVPITADFYVGTKLYYGFKPNQEAIVEIFGWKDKQFIKSLPDVPPKDETGNWLNKAVALNMLNLMDTLPI